MKIVAATCSQQYLADDVLFEPLTKGLPEGLLASPALVNVTRGTVYIPIVNVGTEDVVLHPRTVLGTVRHASLVSSPTGLGKGEVSATVSSQTVASSLQDKIAAVDLTALSEQEQCQVRSLLHKYSLFCS